MYNENSHQLRQLPTNQKFGWFYAGVFITFAIYSFLIGLKELAATELFLSVIFAAVTLISPWLLSPLNRLWYRLGLLLGEIVSPIVLGIIFFLLITPISLIMRLSGRDELKMKKRSVDSYWVARSPPGPSSDSFKNQY